MGMPSGIGIIDTMMGFPHHDMKAVYKFITAQTRDAESKEEFEFPVEYMFKDVPEKGFGSTDDPISMTLREMDLWGIERAMITVGDQSGTGAEAMKRHPDRFIASTSTDPNDGMEGISRIVREYETYGVRAVGVFPAGTFPQVPINDKKMYPVYAKCVELKIPVFCCAGIPGPRLKAACQHVELIDEVMFDFPELVFVTRHGCEPWTELAVKLMLKWPGLHFSTSAFAPKYYPQDIVDYANTRGPTRSSTRATSRWGFPSNASCAKCPTSASRMRCGPSSSVPMHCGCSGWTTDLVRRQSPSAICRSRTCSWVCSSRGRSASATSARLRSLAWLNRSRYRSSCSVSEPEVGLECGASCRRGARPPARWYRARPPRRRPARPGSGRATAPGSDEPSARPQCPMNSAPLIVAMWLVYWTIDWYSVPKSSFSRAMKFSTSSAAASVMPLLLPTPPQAHTGKSDGERTAVRVASRRVTSSWSSTRRTPRTLLRRTHWLSSA